MAKKGLITNTIVYSVGEIFPKIISFLLLPIFTTYLSTSDYGIISYTNSIMFFLLVISSLCLNTYVLREFFNCKSELEKKRLIGNVFSVICLFNIFLLLLSFLVGPSIVNFTHLKIPFYPYFSLSLINNFFEIFSIIPLVIFRVKENALAYVSLNIAKAVLLFLASYILIVHLKWGIIGSFYGKLIVNAVFSIVFIIVAIRNGIFNLNIVLIKKSLKFSLPLIPGAVGFLLMSMSDRIILERYVSLSQLGIYSIAYTVAFSLSIIIQGAYRSFEPEIYREYGKESFNQFIKKMHGLFMAVVFLLATGLAIFSKELLFLMTKGGFVEAYKLIPIILIGVLATAQNVILGSLLIAENKTKISSFSTIIGGVISILFNLFLVPEIGIYSAAMATAVAYLAMNVVIAKGITLDIRFVRADIYALVYFAFIVSIILLFFKSNQFLWSEFFYKMLTLLSAVIVLFRIYRINTNSLNGLIVGLNKKK